MQNEKKTFFSRTSTWGVFAIIFVIGLWLGSIKLIPHFIQTSELGACDKLAVCDKLVAYGQFGDMFGAVNALFSGLAFAGVIIAIILQKEELKLQREELKQTREEFEHQTTEFTKQNKNLAVQRFENTFFNMLELLKPFAKDMCEKAAPTVDSKIENLVLSILTVAKNKDLNIAKKSAEISARIIAANLLMMPYFSTIYSILKLIDQNHILNHQEKKSYSSILRAQFSYLELVLIAYYCAYNKSSILFKLLIEKYSLLKYIPQNYLFPETFGLIQPRAFSKHEAFDVHHYDDIFAEQGIENFIKEE